MEKRIITAAEAKELLEGTTPGPWRTRDGHTYEVGPTVIIESAPVDIDVAIVIETGNPVDTKDARLCAAAPDLAATVVSQAAEIERLRAVIDGRTTPPTDEEIEAHWRAGGAWTVGKDPWGGGGADIAHPPYVMQVRDDPRVTWERVWIPRDKTGRPCAWPVVAEVAR